MHKSRVGYHIPITRQAGDFFTASQDTATFGSQVAKVADSFGGGSVTFVGDRGMIKMPQIQELQAFEQHEFHYITAITKPQIEKLIKDGPIQLNLFEQELAEIQQENGPRYIP